MSKHLFVAIPVERELSEVLVQHTDQYAGLPWLKFEKPDDWHTTVLFLGDVKDELVPEIEDALADIASIQRAFTLEIEKITFAPENQRPSMLWALLKESKKFAQLVLQVKEEMYYILGDTDTKEVLPHITLARFDKKASTPKVMPLLAPIARGVGTMEIAKITLMESKLPTAHKSEAGPTYTTLREFSFAPQRTEPT